MSAGVSPCVCSRNVSIILIAQRASYLKEICSDSFSIRVFLLKTKQNPPTDVAFKSVFPSFFQLMHTNKINSYISQNL